MGRVICNVVALAGLFCLCISQKLENTKRQELWPNGVKSSEALVKLKRWMKAFGHEFPSQSVQLREGGSTVAPQWAWWYVVDEKGIPIDRKSQPFAIEFQCIPTYTALHVKALHKGEENVPAKVSDKQAKEQAKKFVAEAQPDLISKIHSGEMAFYVSSSGYGVRVKGFELRDGKEVIGNLSQFWFSHKSGKMFWVVMNRPIVEFSHEREPALDAIEAHARIVKKFRELKSEQVFNPNLRFYDIDIDEIWNSWRKDVEALSPNSLRLVYWCPIGYSRPSKGRLFYTYQPPMHRLFDKTQFFIDAKTGDIWKGTTKL